MFLGAGSGSWRRRGGLRPLVDLHVRLQTVALREGFVADRAPVRPLAIVRPHVHRQVKLASARFPAHQTHVGFLSRVDFQVVVQVSFAFEGPAAFRTSVRHFPGVDPRVDGQSSFGGEPLAAFAAVVRLLLGVRPHVDLQLLAGQEHFAADVAEVRAISVHVDLLVRFQSSQQFEALPAKLTAVPSLPRVRQLVAVQRSKVAEGFAANAAAVRLLVPACPAASFQLFVKHVM